MIIKENFDLSAYNAYGLKVHCAKAIFPETEEELVNLFREELDQPRIILGNGNNVILGKSSYEQSFIIFNGSFNKIWIDKNHIIAQAGATLEQFSVSALNNNLSGAEIFYDIPSSVGGAVVMNAGASGEEIKNILFKVRYLDLEDLQVKEIFKEDIGFEYRNSFFQKNTDKIVLKAWFNLRPGNRETISLKMDATKANRWAKQPRNYPNCGSVFKRPQGKFVGPMIDELGLKGFTIGGAQVSEKHSGFIVNLGGATGEDILDLIKHIQNKVKDKFDILLEVEQRII
ncbi:UDP-N-acetylenolpyruvoylglucosamine reductase [Salinimicrobium marinum]|uniref:UDP-N-acetylenolpyruvoylglucosamine reductase n=1 Tax=Salinimicrobium marinum TaxID=680283 RepID=A0A918SKT7_9FLAO|nr:UDP-N-acetylmuramate dehydrogenase [Salinimicrobium marinum]GHA46257.1 UDP-N-acetylenolpyruvoylglucosamine reductase [Salinimicrobium marinum]